jgi:phosphoserine phosphatase RsbU/P
MVLCPLRVRGTCLGVIVIVNKHGNAIFDSRDKILLQGLADQAAISVDLVKLYDVLAEQQRLDQELALAQDFQRMLLPHTLPQLEAYEFSAINKTARVVGGDFYDFFPIDQDHLGIVIGDVSGKGVPASLIMAMVRSIIRAEARDTFSPKEVLRRVNEGVKADTKESVFVTITYGILDISNDRLRFARAGHEPLLLRHARGDAGVEAYQPEGMAVGLVPSDIFSLIEEMEIQLEPGDMVLLYTDGVVESLNPTEDEYGRQRLIDLFQKTEEQSAGDLIRVLEADLRTFAKGTHQHDDITLVALKMKQTPQSLEEPEEREVPRRIVESAVTQTA